uniref:Uncharacterized protein n=1 Tax=Candidatus Kentrum sp. LPFa TaxID=2126335 RepID=A0A450WWG5_9GAMM|nr:MAG: hypothetical protein BECKLPF1236B_GA0070989_12522 [Candidatus Kentron sp. LPFa]
MPYQNIDVSLSPADAKAVRYRARETPLSGRPDAPGAEEHLQGPMEKTRTDSVSFIQNARRLYLAKLPGYYSLRLRRMVKNS